MQEPNSPKQSTPPPTQSSVEINDSDVRAGRDIVGGNVNVAGDSISGQNVNVQRGFSASDVQRLVIIVGALVFVTAAFFFALGAIASAAIVSTLQRDLPSGSQVQAAQTMQSKIDQLNSLESGQRFQVQFTEEEVSSYFRFIAGPQLGISNGKVRFMEEAGQIAIGGNVDAMGGIPFAAEVNVTTEEMPLQLQAAWLKLLPTPQGSSIGYFPVTAFAHDFEQSLNRKLFGRVQFTQVAQTGGGAGAQPEIGTRLVLFGVVK